MLLAAPFDEACEIRIGNIATGRRCSPGPRTRRPMHRIRKDQFDFTEPHVPQTGLRRLHNGRPLSDRLLQARASSRRARDQRPWRICKRALGRLAAACPGSKPLPAFRRTRTFHAVSASRR
jgi:hypothetical protein